VNEHAETDDTTSTRQFDNTPLDYEVTVKRRWHYENRAVLSRWVEVNGLVIQLLDNSVGHKLSALYKLPVVG